MLSKGQRQAVSEAERDGLLPRAWQSGSFDEALAYVAEHYGDGTADALAERAQCFDADGVPVAATNLADADLSATGHAARSSWSITPAGGLTWGSGLPVAADVIAKLCDADSAALGEGDDRHAIPVSIARTAAYTDAPQAERFTDEHGRTAVYTDDLHGEPVAATEVLAPQGAYGVKAVDASTPGAMTCHACGRSWVEDITPAGRCPWEHLHDEPVAATEGNPYPLGTVECIAYADGAAYAATHERRENPLSGEWAGDPTPADVIRAVWRELLGQAWDTFTDGTEGDRDDDDAITDAWEEGTREVWGDAPEPDGQVCPDCALIIVNDDDSGAPQAHRAAMAAQSARTGIPASAWTVGEHEDTFSTAPCATCGSTLAGARLSASLAPEHQR